MNHDGALRPDDRREPAAGFRRSVPYETPGDVRGEDQAHRGEAERGEEERIPLHQALADQLLDDLDVFLPRIDAVRRPHVMIHVQEEREGPEERTDDDDAQYDAEVIDEQMPLGR